MSAISRYQSPDSGLETSSMTAWWAASSISTVSTKQSTETYAVETTRRRPAFAAIQPDQSLSDFLGPEQANSAAERQANRTVVLSAPLN